MKIDQIYNENANTVDKLSDKMYSNYSIGIDRLLNNDWNLFKGIKSNINDIKEMLPKQDRKPAYASNLFYYYAFNNLVPWTKLPSRSVICSKDYNIANEYGKSYYVIPENDAILCELPAHDLWFSFDPEKLLSVKISNPYRANLNLLSSYLETIVTNIAGTTLSNDNFMKLLSNADVYMKNNKINIEELPKTTIVKSLLNNKHLKDSVIDYFNIDIKTYNMSNIKFDNDHEIWFNGNYLIVPYDKI